MVDLAFVAGCLVLGGDPALLMAIVEQESAKRVSAFNVNEWNGERFASEDVGEAAIAARAFVRHGYTVDVGLAGINSRNLERFGVTIEAAFEPCLNLSLGERIFLEGRAAAVDLGHEGEAADRVALSFYNTGSPTRGFDNGYVENVWARFDTQRTREAAASIMAVPQGVSGLAPNREGMNVAWPAPDASPVEEEEGR